jgi:hypothetical protein
MTRYRSANLTPWPMVRKLVLVAVGVVLLVMLLIWWRTTVTIDRVIAQAAPFAEITRGSVFVWPNGDIGVRHLTVYPLNRPGGGTWRAGAITVHTPGLFWIVRTGLFGMSALPDRLGIDVDDLVVDGIEAASEPEIVGSASAALFDNAGCQRQGLTASDVIGFGIPSAPSRMRIAHRIDAGNAMVWTMEVARPGSAAWTVESEIKLGGTRPDDPAAWMTAEFVRAEARFDDDGFLAARNRACAETLRITEAAFIDAHIERVAATLRYFGVGADRVFLDSYREYVQGGGSYTVGVRPRGNRTLATLFTGGASAVSNLMISARVGDGRTQPLALSFGAPDRGALGPRTLMEELEADIASESAPTAPPAAAVDNTSSQAEAPASTRAATTPPPATAAAVPGWRDIAYADLKPHVGRRIQLVTRLGIRREGTLERYTAAGISVRLTGRDGGIALALTPQEIRELRVAE